MRAGLAGVGGGGPWGRAADCRCWCIRLDPRPERVWGPAAPRRVIGVTRCGGRPPCVSAVRPRADHSAPCFPPAPRQGLTRGCWPSFLWRPRSFAVVRPRRRWRGLASPRPGVLLLTQAVSQALRSDRAADHSSHGWTSSATRAGTLLPLPITASPSRWELLRSFQTASNPQQNPASLNPPQNHLQKPQFYKESFLIPSKSPGASPRCVVSLAVTGKNPSLLSYRCVPGGLPGGH